MGPKKTRRFLYDAHGLALGGRITRPFNEVVEATAAVALPISGGQGTTRKEQFAYRDLVTFKSASTTVAGTETEGHWTTTVTVEIDGLNVMGVVTADRIVARLVSERAKTEPSDGEAPILPAGSSFENLRVGGALVKTRLTSRCAENATFSTILKSPRLESPKHLPEVVGMPLFECEMESGGSGASMLEAPRAEGPPGLETAAMTIDVPEFGRVFVGEFYLTPKSRRLNMLRLELASRVEGEIVVAGIGGNGSPYP
jgi:hypothetical protein